MHLSIVPVGHLETTTLVGFLIHGELVDGDLHRHRLRVLGFLISAGDTATRILLAAVLLATAVFVIRSHWRTS